MRQILCSQLRNPKVFFLIFLLAFIPSVACAFDVQINGINYSLKIGSSFEAEVIEGKYAGDMVIPSSVNYNGIDYTVTSIHSSAFAWHTTLSSVTMPNTVKTVGYGAFYGCSGLTSVTLSNRLSTLASNLFCDCTSLVSVTIPSSVTRIESEAFARCTNLAFIDFPDIPIIIGSGVFEGTAWYDNQPDGLVYAGNILYCYKGKIPYGSAIVIKEGTLGIADHAFFGGNHYRLTNVSIPNSVKYIGTWAFMNTGLKSVEIPASVEWIGYEAFSHCENLENITVHGTPYVYPYAFDVTAWYQNLPDGPVYVGNLFYGWRGELPFGAEVAIKEGTKGIVRNGYSNWYNLTSVTIPNSVEYIGERAFDECKYLTSVTIPNSVKHIGEGAFAGCEGLTTVYIPDGVTKIDNAFYECSNLTFVRIPNSVISMNHSFTRCTSLTTVSIPDGVKEFECAFEHCSSLSSVTIPQSVTSIDDLAFYGCTALTSLSLPGVRHIGHQAFGACTGLTSLSLPDVKDIDNSAFHDCTALASMSMPNVIGVGNGAFRDSRELTSLSLPKSVAFIGPEAFKYCENIVSVQSGIENVFDINIDVFNWFVYNAATLYVPSGTVESYRRARGWQEFKIISEDTYGSSPTLNTPHPDVVYHDKAFVITGAEGSTVEVLDLSGRLMLNEKLIEHQMVIPFSRKGAYLVRIEKDDEIIMRKTIIVE